MRANRGIVFTLGGLAAISPLSGDMYLAAFPAIATDLNASVTQVQLTLTASLLGLSSGQLVIGPLSDLWGRRPPLLTGIILYVLASLGCAFAGSIELLIALRFCQGFAGAAAVVLSRAMVRDLYTGTAAVRVFSQMMAVFGVAPVIAPVIGSALLTVGNWRAIFLVLAGAGALQLLAVLTTLGETLPPERRQSGGLRRIPGLVRAVFSDPPFLGAALSCGFAFGAMFAYIAASPFLLQEVYGASPLVYGGLFAVNAAGLTAMTQLNSRLAARIRPERLLLTGIGAQSAAGVALLGVAALDPGRHLAALALPLFVVISALGLVMPTATALALARFPGSAGTASSVMGALHFTIGALIAPLAGIGAATAVPFAAMITAMSLAGLTVTLTLGPVRLRRTRA